MRSARLPRRPLGARFERRKRAIGLVAAPVAAVLVAIVDRGGPAPALTALIRAADEIASESERAAGVLAGMGRWMRANVVFAIVIVPGFCWL